MSCGIKHWLDYISSRWICVHVDCLTEGVLTQVTSKLPAIYSSWAKNVAKLEKRDIEQSAAKTGWFSNGCTLMTIASRDWTFCHWCWGIPDTAGFSNSSYIWTWWGKRDRELPIWCKTFSLDEERHHSEIVRSDNFTAISLRYHLLMTRSCRFCFQLIVDSKKLQRTLKPFRCASI